MQLDFGDEQLSSVRGFPVNLTQLLAHARLLVMTATSGERSSEFYAKLNPNGFWGKMSQDSLLQNEAPSLDEYSMTWTRAGTGWSGLATALPLLEQSTVARGSSSLPTARASEGMTRPLRNSPSGVKGRLEGAIAAECLPTPAARDWKGRGMKGQLPTVLLPDPNNLLPTPNAFDANNFQKKDLTDKTTKNGKQGGRSNLREAFPMEMLPTPRAGKVTNENEESWRKRQKAGKVATPPLALAVQMLPTPTTQNAKGGSSGMGTRGQQSLNSMMLATPAAADCQGTTGGSQTKSLRTDISQYRAETGEHGILNPLFVSRMMGFPDDWARLPPSEINELRAKPLRNKKAGQREQLPQPKQK